jgi:hypothetical protein
MGTTRDTSQLFELADAVVDAINAAVLAETLSLTPVEVKRGYDITYQLKNTEPGAVYIGVAIGEDGEEPGGARRSVSAASQIQVGVRVLVADRTNATIDPLVAFEGELRDLFRGQRLAWYPADCQSATLLIPFIPEHLQQMSQFTGVVTLTFDTQNIS